MANPSMTGGTILTEARVDEMRAMLSAAFANLKLRYREASRVGADESLRAAVNEEILCIGRLHASVVLELNMASVPSLNVQFAAKSLMGDLKGYAALLDNEFVELARTLNVGDGAAGVGMPSPIRGGSDAGSTVIARPTPTRQLGKTSPHFSTSHVEAANFVAPPRQSSAAETARRRDERPPCVNERVSPQRARRQRQQPWHDPSKSRGSATRT